MLLVVLLFVLYILWWYYNDNKQFAGFPPGPRRYPFVGNLIQIARLSKIPVEALFQLSKKYGDIMHIRFGLVDVLVISTYPTVKEFRNNDELQHAAQMSYIKIRHDNKNRGIIFSNDDVWQTMRRYTIRTLRDFGFAKSSLTLVIQEEANKLVEYVHQRKLEDGTLLNMESLFDLPAINVVWSMISGKAFSLDDERIHELLRLSNAHLKAARYDDLAIAYPFLHDWVPRWSGKVKQTEKLKHVLAFLQVINNTLDFPTYQQLIDEHAAAKDSSEEPKCFIDCFLSRIGEPLFTKDQMVYVLLDLFQAGSDTTSNTLAFSILYLILHPEKQEKVWQELSQNDKNVKECLPYTHAAILESLRHSTVIPLYPLREVPKDMILNGYKVKKGMPLMISSYSVHFDEKVWGDARNFRPERFLRNGVIDKSVADQLLPFGAGKRECLGRPMAEDTLFVFFTTLLRNFRFEMHKDDKNLSMEPMLGLSVSPYPFRCMVTPRT